GIFPHAPRHTAQPPPDSLGLCDWRTSRRTARRSWPRHDALWAALAVPQAVALRREDLDVGLWVAAEHDHARDRGMCPAAVLVWRTADLHAHRCGRNHFRENL